MDDFDFIEDDDLDINAMFDNQDDIPLDDEFIRTHFNTIPDGETIQNFPFVEDDIDAITDYELFSKGFGYLDDKKADKEELSDYVKKDELPPLDDFVTKDTTDLENYTLTSDLSSVALTGDYDDLTNKPSLFSGDYNDLTNKPTIPTKTSDLTNDSGFITKDVNDLTNYTLTSSLSSVATSGSYNDLSNKPTIPDVSNFITKDVNNLTYYTLSSNLASVATSGSYNDLSNKPTIPDVSNFITKDVNDLTNYTLTSSLSSVATSGSYNDLSNKPTIPTIERISQNDFINSVGSGVTIAQFNVSKVGKFISGTIQIQYNADITSSNLTVFSIKNYIPVSEYVSYCTMASSQWKQEGIGYLYVGSGGWIIKNDNNTSGFRWATISFSYMSI